MMWAVVLAWFGHFVGPSVHATAHFSGRPRATSFLSQPDRCGWFLLVDLGTWWRGAIYLQAAYLLQRYFDELPVEVDQIRHEPDQEDH
jgi:hypothetical protein